MSAGVVIDTSFLITLLDSDRPHHATAEAYWRAFLEAGIPLYLSTIVVAEFTVRQPLPDTIVSRCLVLPFNWSDAETAARIWPGERSGERREVLKDDLKILAQAIEQDASLVISEDANTFLRYAERLRREDKASFRPIRLSAGFDRSHLDPNGQSDFHVVLETAGDYGDGGGEDLPETRGA